VLGAPGKIDGALRCRVNDLGDLPIDVDVFDRAEGVNSACAWR
jgi:hypothetical protein